MTTVVAIVRGLLRGRARPDERCWLCRRAVRGRVYRTPATGHALCPGCAPAFERDRQRHATWLAA